MINLSYDNPLIVNKI